MENVTRLFIFLLLMISINGCYYTGKATILDQIETATSTSWLGTIQMGISGTGTDAEGIAFDNQGNFYVAGISNNSLYGQPYLSVSFDDAFITKYDSLGNMIWSRRLGAPGYQVYALAVTLDFQNNVYICGGTTGGLDGNTQTGGYDFFVTKFDNNGNKIWTRQLGAGSTTECDDVKVDLNGNAFVGGYTFGNLDAITRTGSTDFFLTKYDSNGNKIWTKLLGVVGKFTYGYGVSVDNAGDIYIGGTTRGGLDGNTLTGLRDLFITKYDNNGNKLWTSQLGVASFNTYGSKIAHDTHNNIVITGNTSGNLDGITRTGYIDAFIVKYDSNGNKLWTKLLGTTLADTSALNITTDQLDNVYITGYTTGNLDGNILTGTQDLFLSKFDANGNKIWTRQKGAIGASNFTTTGIAIDQSNNLLLSGYTDNGFDGNVQYGVLDLFVIKFDSNGNKK